ncbi:hypothetical protein JJB07_03070 [Tumebacillus sp. ITR2]|uniref:Microcin J25-processing protein McjB C-terminal domain-containing protein n=1 Tax=Tumebacillus amylolyticus TaxID=2801339 RepID=A0ABS1J5R5_9BACL|nr:hypothetical protein [Tumebacillus amylolyticus]MBL0385622.1 hypothetical protein [Tumebacillus amylolyticus]
MKLTQFASRFRRMMEKCDPSELLQIPALSRFPRGACGDTSDLLAMYLVDNGFSNVSYVCGMDGSQSHAWLEFDGWLVDITADQFVGVDESVIVTKDRSFHDRFKRQISVHGNPERHNKQVFERLSSAYLLVLSKESECS